MNQKVNDSGVLAVPVIVIDNLADGRLTYKQLREDGTIEVELSTLADPDSLRVEVQMFPPGAFPVPYNPIFVVATKEKTTEPGGVWTFPLRFTVNVRGLVDQFDPAGNYKEWQLAFVAYDQYDNFDTSTQNTPIFIDLTAPWQTQPGPGNHRGIQPPILATPPTPTVIDDAWLADPTNAGGLNLAFNVSYPKFEAGLDQARFYLSTRTNFPAMQDETEAFSGPISAGGTFNVPLTFLQGLPEGRYFYAYELEDAPGNISRNSQIYPTFQVRRAPAPQLDVPRIPITGTDGRTPITLATVAGSSLAVMEIDVHTSWLATDRIIPYMQAVGSAGAPLVAVRELPVGTGNSVLRFVLDYVKMNEVFGDENGQDEIQFEYWYELARATIPINPVSRSAFALVDFSYGGPEQPNLPDLENFNIPAVIVQGGGTPTPPINTLAPAQAGLDAEMQAPLEVIPPRVVTGREIYSFYYQGALVDTRSPTAGQTTPLTCPLPWQRIRDAGNGTVAGGNPREAYVTIELPGSANIMRQSPVTPVNVTAIVINLPQPQIILSAHVLTVPGQQPILIPERNSTTLLNCPALDHPPVAGGPVPPYLTRRLRVRVRRDVNIPTGTMVSMRFVGRTTNDDTATDIAGTVITPTALPMPPTGDLEFWLTDYAAIKLIQLPVTTPGVRPPIRYARISYTANGVQAVTTVIVSLLNTSLVLCDVERPEPPPAP